MNEPSKQIQQKNNVLSVTHEETVTFSGPLPPPHIVERYERVLPGAAERIFKMAEDQSRHRRDLETLVIHSDIRNSKLGLVFGLIIGLAALIAAVIMVYFGNVTGGSLLGVGTITALVGVFVYGSQGRKKERKEKQQEK